MPIHVNGLTVNPILKSINCTLSEHTLTLVIGQSGCGKSTFLQGIAGLLRLDSGSVAYDEIPLWRKNKVNREVLLRHAIAFQYPEHQLFAATVQEEFNYTLRPYRVSREEGIARTKNALQELQLSQGKLDQSPFELSGGQKRSVAVATLLATNTPWLLLDEPSAGLDAKTSARLRDQLTVWKMNKGIVMATHDWEFFLPITDRILLISEGQLLADLTPAELMSTPSLLHQAGLGIPDSLKVSCEMQGAGFSLATEMLSPEQMAEAIITQLEGANVGGLDTSVENKSMFGKVNLGRINPKPVIEEPKSIKPKLYRMDARLKWLMFLVLSVVILLQHQWPSLIVTMIVSLAALFLLDKAHAIQALRMCKPLLLFIIVAATFASVAITLHGGFQIHFNMSLGLSTIQVMFPFLAVTIISFVFTLSTSTMEMRTGIEKALSIVDRFGIPTKMLALTASLILRFIPMILIETERFSLIAAARGKRVVRKGQISIRDILVFTIPLLISLFQMVEDLIVALEIKGFKDKSRRSEG